MVKIVLAYAAAIVAWSTTPIGIKFTSVTLNPSLSLYYRFSVTALLGLLILKIARIHMPWDKVSVKAYVILGFSLGGGLLAAYRGFQTLPSGLGAVIFGLGPIVAALVERLLIPAHKVTLSRYLASLVGLVGLIVIFIGRNPNMLSPDMAAVDSRYEYSGIVNGAMYLFLSLVIFNYGGVNLRKHILANKMQTNPFAISIGGFMVFSVALGLVILAARPWMPSLYNGPATVSELMFESLGIVYMAVVGSIIGFSSYNYIVMRLSVQTASMVNFVTPIAALALGAWLNAEVIFKSDFVGTGCVLLSIMMYLFGDQVLSRFKRSSASMIERQVV